MISFREFVNREAAYQEIDSILTSSDGASFQLCEERKWIDGRFKKNIGLDRAHVPGQKDHAHIYGRCKNQIGVVNIDGTGSHGTKMKLSRSDASALRNRGFKIPDNRIVEWIYLDDVDQLLLG